jgi:general nucleoside transport system ATP-binding protein
MVNNLEPNSVPMVELRGLTKVFGPVVGNDNVSLHIEQGSIHGVIGENGAGKSTAMKMLYGIYRPDGGEILIHGRSCQWESPSDAISAGIGMVHQHFMLARPYSALDNILLGAEPSRFASIIPRWLRPIDREAARMKLEGLARQYGLSVEWDSPIEKLSVGIQQRIEILKLLYREAKILILDEPTAVLTPQETNELFANLRKLRSEGKTIIIITHKLREVIEFTDRVTVFRAGRVTGEVSTRETNAQELANLMVGRKVVLQVEVPPQPELGEPILKVEALTLGNAAVGIPGADSDNDVIKNRLNRISFKVQSGEIVGIAGVEGNGQSELLQALLHPTDTECLSSGSIQILGRDATAMTADQIKALGVGVIPEDRHRDGLLLERPVDENFILGMQGRAPFSRAGLLDWQKIRQATARAMEEYDVRPRSLDSIASRLSGGNQQKLIISREFERDPKLLIAAQPTRGVDVGAIEFIHKKIIKARQDGAGVLLVSSELDEILTLSDRILVMYEGSIVGEFSRGECSEQDLGLRMGGHA